MSIGEYAELDLLSAETYDDRTLTMQIENVPLPDDTTKKVSKRGRKKQTKPNGASSLIKALQFVNNAQKSMGTSYQTHCLLNAHWAVAFDGILTIGTKIEEDVSACPRTADLLAALSKCGETLSITQLNENVLSVKSDKFNAKIKCVQMADLPLSFPDNSSASCNDELKKAFEALAWLAVEGASNPSQAAVLLQNGSCVATNGHVLLEYWHGLNVLPQGANVLIPKSSIVALLKIDKPLKAFGFSQQSATFYYEDESFVKTQLFVDNYPNYEAVFNKQSGDVTPLPKDFIEAVEAVAPFSENKFVYMRGATLQSHNVPELGAQYQLKGIPERGAYNLEYLRGVAPYFCNVVFSERMAWFKNGNVRGVICGGTDA